MLPVSNSLAQLQASPFPPAPWPRSILPSLKTCKTMKDLQQFHAKSIKTGLIGDTLIAAEILRFAALSHDRDLRYARLVFDEMPEPNVFSWNTLIRAFSESEFEPLQALSLFLQMLNDESVQPNRYTLPSVLKSCARSGALEEGKQIHGFVAKIGLQTDDFVLSNLVRMYAMCGCMEDACFLVKSSSASSEAVANVVLHNVLIEGFFGVGMAAHARRIFDEMPQRSVISWNAMISKYAQIGLFQESVDVFQKMLVEGVMPNYVTLISILPAIARLGALDFGEWVHLYAEENEILVDDVLGSALVDMYSKCGNVDKALELFKGLPKSNPITWSALIGGLALHGRGKEAIDYFSMMEHAGLTPSSLVFIALLNACCVAGMVDLGWAYFECMTTVYGLNPDIEHYTCMVDMLGRAGLLEQAEKIVMSLPMKPDDTIFKALLAACQSHGDVEMGIRVAKSLIKIAPCDGASYMLLSNMYASLGDSEAVAQVRQLMKELDIPNDPGCSWVTVDGAIHEFLNFEDDQHPRTSEINAMLEEITAKLHAAGYDPDSSQVLLDIDEEEKESFLRYHSEKKAISLGLISTSPGTTLHVMKSLRVCSDCHSSIKLISNIYSRRIVVRDKKRFHYFENGTCSCNDYW
ncbi:TPR-like protein [Dioscorea alata]|uniref:TPR-like protein n=1 Tax=Dioscorea alata TaxID=55571 RepID=A0ACB7UB10_DIOAL|nr:TPR-like protein [Dioscorea alata]